MSNARNESKKKNVFISIVALIVSASTVAGAVGSGGMSESKTGDSRLLIVMIDIPFMGFGSRRLVRLPVVFPVPAI